MTALYFCARALQWRLVIAGEETWHPTYNQAIAWLMQEGLSH